MSLKVVIGRAGSGKSTLCLEEIRRELRTQPWGPPIILLVPEQATYQMEVALANTPELGGSLRAQVLSFRRMGWRVLAETGGGLKALIGATGKRMLLRRILLKHRFELKAFARSATRPGMAELLAQAIAEFKLYRVTPADLRQVSSAREILGDKLNDLALIYEEFQSSLGQVGRDPDDELSVLAEKIPGAPLIQGARVWVDGFTGYTPQELEVLKNLLTTAAEVVVTIPLDPGLFNPERGGEEGQLRVGEELFTGSWQTWQSLQRLAAESGIPMHPPLLLETTKRFKHPWLGHLEKYYSAYPTKPYAEIPSNDLNPGIQILSAVNRRAEVEGVARELRRLARDEGLSWQDMSVMTRDLSGYHELISQVFTAYAIPLYIDHKHSILHHPLIELVLSSLEVAASNWGYEPLFRCLKTDFFPLSRDAVDRLENYVLEHGIGGRSWSGNVPWRYHRQWSLGRNEVQHELELKLESQLNSYRATIHELLAPLCEVLAAKGEGERLTVREISKTLFDFLAELQVPLTLKTWADQARKAGELSEARLHEQLWPAIMQVLDEIVSSLGDEQLELEDYSLILASGIEGLELGQIPPGLDQVLVGSLDRSRNPEVRVQFLLGANEGVLPARPASEGVLDYEERKLLEKEGVSLAPKGKAQTFEEQFYIYTAFSRAREKLVITYPLTDEEGKGLTVSSVILRLKQLFPIAEEYLGNQEPIACISQADTVLQYYAEQMRTLRRGERLSPLWEAAERWLSESPRHQGKLNFIRSGLLTKNQEEQIQRPLARRLYGKRLMASVSRLEQFAKCPFGHFARYGLKLRERSTYQLSKPDMGQFFHTLLHDFALQLQERGLDWGRLTREESWALISELADQLAPSLQHEILLSSARYRYLTHKLKRTVHHAVRVLGEHARRGVFIPIQLEVKFGPDETLPGVEIPLSEGDTLLLSGQIDRVDAAFLNGQVFLRILDYKSREQSLSLDTIYYGLNLQLLTYLNVALEGAEVLLNAASPATPAGFLYFPVLEPQLEEKSPLSAEELELQRLKAVKISGYLLANPQVLEAMDSSFTSGRSDLLGLKLNKDGTFRKGANVLTEEQFSLLQKYLYHTLRQSGEEIISGNISLSPYRRGQNTGCQYCSYRPVCHFDPYLSENHYRDLLALNQEELWQRLESIPAHQTANLPPKEDTAPGGLHWLEGGDLTE
ncbi:helicase-exonuclease AddAB subunit AddB [Desulfosporosinus sp. PR]|uniref:helicase-exonuclease AddAB subunit AddB n=1 Tax=Candidatus Desulfosporosinus nitrosoreducens TaxID=3401928 RepID=UPI0027FA4EDD|nr:helicase-exonuclease AddAB subunit AddB [Desulfosporosinus sp. PR]MDQ7093435.1 helicase-exonuclease AddAB subunit AddB [Desulfosporosinus sp. PR]